MRIQLWRMLIAIPLLVLAVGCVARVETDPAPSRIDVHVDPPAPRDPAPSRIDVHVDPPAPRKLDVDIDVTPKKP